jgi:hypothetical protein
VSENDTMINALTDTVETLLGGAARHAAADPATRAQLALATARSVAAAAPVWAEAAIQIKRAHGELHEAAVRAEELATGPLVTLRLLLITARALEDIAATGRPRLAKPPQIAHRASGSDLASVVEVDLLPARGLLDAAIFQGYRATARCTNPGSIEAFLKTWREECITRPRGGGVAVVLGAGNVTGLAVADAICQIFEHGRAALVKLHPAHEPLASVLRNAVAPLVEAGLVAFVVGGTEIAREAIAADPVTHVHLTGGAAAFAAVATSTTKPITCELGNVTPWFIVPGRYTPAQLRFQADTIAASIANNTSFNCIATKLVVTCRSWEQRGEFIGLIRRRLESLPPRPAWYPGAAALWEEISGRAAADDGSLPWVFRDGLRADADEAWIMREWFGPVAGELPLDAADVEAYCTRAAALARSLPGSLAASVTVPEYLSTRDAARADLLLEHLPFGIVGRNCWSALAYSMASIPWGGYPGGTRGDPKSGIGFVHDPLLLPLVHNSIIRGPLAARRTPPWFPWHSRGGVLARGLVDMYGAIARGGSGVWQLARMLPAVLRG